jgi:hypothetical protein
MIKNCQPIDGTPQILSGTFTSGSARGSSVEFQAPSSDLSDFLLLLLDANTTYLGVVHLLTQLAISSVLENYFQTKEILW